EAAVVARVIHDMEKNLRPRHRPPVPSDQDEGHLVNEVRFRQPIAPGDIPVVQRLLIAPELSERRMSGRVARGKPMLASLQVRLPDEVDDVVVIERMDYFLEEAAALLRRLAFGWGGDRLENELVCPMVIAREHARGFRSNHGRSRRILLCE